MSHVSEEPHRRWMGVGRSSEADSRTAGRAAARAALTGAGPSLLVVFGSSGYDPGQLLAGVHDAAGEVPVIGCSTAGELAPDGSRDGTVVVAAVGGPGLSVSTAASDNITGRQRDAGAAVAACAADFDAADDPDNRVLILLTDGLAGEQEEILRGAYDVLGASIPLFGGGAAGGPGAPGTYQLHRHDVLYNGAVGASLISDGPIGIGVRHGWRKTGGPMIVTGSDAVRVLCLDDRPAVDAYLDRLGAPTAAYHDRAVFSRWALTRPLGIQRRGG